ncbi:MAG TPA: adenosine kinase [Acidimicrobiales bacterium]|nr:adenosine kinase [Acidimicrobiales bacterium]
MPDDPDARARPGGDDDLLDVVGIGSPLVDVLARATEADLDRLGLIKGSTALVDLVRAESIHSSMADGTELSGGSAANTMVGVAALGGAAGFVGKVNDDRLGAVFTRDIRAAGVLFEPVPGGAPDTGDTGTGRCLILVTGDAERTMATHLGVAGTITPDDVPLDLVARCQLLYLEGYLWDLPPAKEAMRRAVEACHDHDGSVAFSLSDPFCVDRHRREFLDLLLGDVDVLFGNEEELVALFGAGSFEDAVSAAEETGLLVAATRGARGSVVLTVHGPVEVAPRQVAAVDATGAGDLYAAGFLFGLSHGQDPVRCAELGTLCAAEVISHMGGRPVADLAALAAEAGLL